MLADLGGVGRGGGHDPAIVGQARGRAVIHDEAVLAQHDAIARLADRQGGERVDVEAVEQLADVGALQFDLAEGRNVDEPDRRAHGFHFTVDRLLPVRLALARKIGRAQPGAGLDENGAEFFGQRVGWREPRRAEIDAAMMTGEGAQSHRRPRRAEHGDAGFRDRLAQQFRQNGEARHIGQLALVGRHAERGVALEMFDRNETFLFRQRHVLGGDVVLEVDEGHAFGAFDMPERRQRERRVRRLAAQSARWRKIPAPIAACAPFLRAIGETGGEAIDAVGGAGDESFRGEHCPARRSPERRSIAACRRGGR